MVMVLGLLKMLLWVVHPHKGIGTIVIGKGVDRRQRLHLGRLPVF